MFLIERLSLDVSNPASVGLQDFGVICPNFFISEPETVLISE